MDPRFKEVDYSVFFSPRYIGKVAYVIIGREVFFSGLTRTTTTINAAEEIIRAICEAEGIRWQDFTFVDIQTHCGYPKTPGDFEADVLELRSGEELTVEGWRPANLPKEVRQLFDDLIMR